LSNAALSVTATTSDLHDKPVGVAAMLARREVIAAVAIAGLVAGVGGGVLLATSGHLVRPVAYGLQASVMIVGSVGVALYWAVRRPGNRSSPSSMRTLRA
jgi:drug/metabolite transporter (DMT)-like permease